MTPRATEAAIRTFCADPEKQMEFWALLKVSRDKGDDAMKIAQVLMTDLLFKFHGIPLRSQDQN